MRHFRFLLAATAAAGLLVSALGFTAAPAAAAIDQRPVVGWQPNARVLSMTAVGNMVILSGSFTALTRGGTTVARSRLAAVDATTGELLPWNPGANGDVHVVQAAPDGSGVYVGGSFSSVGGVSRANLAKITPAGGVTSFRADTNEVVTALHPAGSSLYVGGNFTSISGVARGRGAVVDVNSGAVGAWNPAASWTINDIAPSPDGALFIAGVFTSVAGVARNHIAKVASSSGALQSWVPGMSCQSTDNPCVGFELAVSGTTLYAGVGGPGGWVSAMDVSTGRQRWARQGDGDVQALILDGSRVYAGGHFEADFGGQPRAGIVVLDAATGAVVSDITARVTGGTAVWALLRTPSSLHFGGAFSAVGTTAVSRYASMRFAPDSTPSAPATPSPQPTGTTAPSVASPPAQPTHSPQPPGALALAAPTGLAGRVKGRRAVLTWRPTPTADAYTVYRNGRKAGTTSASKFIDFGVVRPKRYRYSVVATGDGQSPPSAVLQVRGKLPALPGKVRAIARNGRLRVKVLPRFAKYDYSVTIQVRARGWRSWQRVRTSGGRDVVVVDAPSGTYRVVVPSQLGVSRAVSRPLRIS